MDAAEAKADSQWSGALSPAHLLLVIVASIFLVEFGIMLVLQVFIPPMRLLENFIDAFALTIVEYPAIYFLAFRPLARLNAEERAAKDALAQLERNYRQLFETMHDGIVLVDFETGVVDDVNDAIVHMLGYDKSEFVGKRAWEIAAVHAIVKTEQDFRALSRALSTGKPLHLASVPLVRNDGALMDVEVYTSTYAAGDRKIIQTNIRDLTELREAQKKQAEYLKSLENANKLMVGRELKMVELKNEMEELRRKSA